MLDTTGPGLHKRGYRAVGVAAPLRETLAAAMVLLSKYRGRDPFCDPFCGSGTIAIEAALIAKNRAPGLDRSFSAQKWSWLPDRRLDGGRRGGHGQGVPRGLRHLGRGHRPQGGGHRPGQRREGGGGGPGALRGGRRPVLPPGGALRQDRHQSPLRGADHGEAGGRGPLPGLRPGLPGPARRVDPGPPLLPHRVRADLRPHPPTEAQALQRHAQMRSVPVRKARWFP